MTTSSITMMFFSCHLQSLMLQEERQTQTLALILPELPLVVATRNNGLPRLRSREGNQFVQVMTL